MKINIKSVLLSILTIFLATAIVVVVVKATTGGLLTPPSNAFDQSGNPQGTMHTLDDIYQAIPSTTITWQSSVGLILCWNAGQYTQANGCNAGNGLLDPTGTGAPLLGAVEYCNYLEADGATIAETPQNIWRLPTVGELMQGMNQGFIINNDGGGFIGLDNYFSSTPVIGGTNTVYSVNYTNGTVFSGPVDESAYTPTRCVRDLPLIADGGSCTSSLQCVSNFCSSFYTCGKLADGSYCGANNDCINNACNSGNRCVTTVGEGSSCSYNEDCISQACDPISHACKPVGWTCITDPTTNAPLCLQTSTLTWQTTIAPAKGWAGAVTYCNKLDVNQVEQSSAQNYWHLPTIQELVAGLTDQFKNNPPSVSGFSSGDGLYQGYWSSNLNSQCPGDNVAWGAGNGYVFGSNCSLGSGGGWTGNGYHVRCVH